MLLSISSIPTVPTPAAAWTFDEGTGTTAADSSGNGHNLTLSAGASWTAGNVGTNALKVNGTATGVATATGPVVDTGGSFTVSAWVNLATVSGYETVVSIAGTNVAGFFFGLRQDTGAFSFARIPSDSTTSATVIAATSAPAANTWYHIVGVDDATAGTLTLYVDGQSQGSAIFTSGWTATGDTLIGHGFYNGSQVDYVNGSIDDVQFFSSALSAAQVAALDQPAAYSFDDGSGTTAADVSGHGNTLTVGSGVTWTTGHTGSNALAFNGSSTGNAINASPVLNTANSFSVSAWVNLNSLSSTQTFVSIDGAHTSSFALQYRSDTGQFAFTRFASDTNSATSTHADGTAAPTTGTWYNLVGVNNVATGQLLLYVNGALQSSVAYTTGWQGTGATVIGAGLVNGARANFANAIIDDVHFYDSPLTASVASFLGTGGNSTINIAMGSSGITVSPNLFGAFMEDINYGGEGGIYNDEVRNSGFNDSTNALNAWAALTGTGVTANLSSDTTTGPTTALTQSGKLIVTSGVSAASRVGISNTGYFGVAIAPSTSYTVDFWAKATAGFTGPLTIDLESTTGTVFATASINALTTSWAEYTATLTTTANAPTTSTNLFVISTNSASANGQTLWFGATYLYPPAYQNQANHLRIDLMQKLAALHPAIFRVPGGNYLEGNTYADRFNWSTTVGPVDQRPGHLNSAWGYWSTDGMGLDEYLQMAEEVGSAPILAVYAGYTLNGSSDTGATLANDVTDAINELHYVLDPVTTSWGALRAANGHPAPYNVPYVEVGNEDFFASSYSTRYPLFYNAIRAAFPQLQIIATSTNTGGSPFDILDEHFYNSPSWFESNSHYYDSTTRGSYKIFIGEYAANEGSPTNDMNSALGDAAWLLGLERNSDLVTMSSYAPIWVNVNGHQWTPDLIGFDGNSSYGSPSYYAQLMLNLNHGTTIVSNSVSGATSIQTLVTKTGSTYYVTVINTGGPSNTATINLNGITSVSNSATVTSLAALAGNATNSITNPMNIIPVTSTVSGLSPNFSYTFPGYSITILQFNATVDTPTVATPAAANPSPVTGTTSNLSVLGADVIGEANLTYTWAATGPASVGFATNGTNASKNATATFSAAGNYSFTVTITNPSVGTTATSTVLVTVNQTASGFSVTPGTGTIVPGGTIQLLAGSVDQFGNVISSPSSITWSITSGQGTIMPNGTFVASAAPGSTTIHASDGSGHTGNATITVAAATAWYQANASNGTTLADSSGNGNNANLTGSTSFSSGVSGNALTLSGGYASLPANIVKSLSNFTISAWVNIATLANWSRIFDFGSGTTTYMFLSPDAGGTNKLRFSITTSGYNNEQQLNGPALSTNTWTHIAVTLAGTNATMYVNGLPVATNANMTLNPSSLGNTNQNYLGKSQFNDPAFNGSIDDFRIYNVALSAQQIAELAAPAIILPASVPSSNINASNTTLSVLATDVTAGEPALTYTWSAVGTPPAPVTFTKNGTNAGKNTTATFTKAGRYTLQVSITNPIAGTTTTSSVTFTVLAGDANQDGKIDLTDLSTVLNNFGAATSAWTSGNFDGSGTVDLTDLSFVLNNFGTSFPAAATAIDTAGATSAAVSEPSSSPSTPDTSGAAVATDSTVAVSSGLSANSDPVADSGSTTPLTSQGNPPSTIETPAPVPPQPHVPSAPATNKAVSKATAKSGHLTPAATPNQQTSATVHKGRGHDVSALVKSHVTLTPAAKSSKKK
ncbi:MAG TPA: LamG-like jellyroll fold domain-containing protein [Phycisphaerae bacterium]|nr:LamG-like jellyroll fold domain-containing protein [Phycisphaerae bacterium]